MKILMPSLRARTRYLAFEVISSEPVKREDLIREIFSVSGSLLGDLGSSECAIRLLAFEGQKGVIRCAHERTDSTRAVLACITSVKGVKVIVHVMGVSGSVAGATKKYLAGVDIFNPTEQSRINE